MNIKVGDQSYQITKLQKFFGYWEFRRVVSADRNLYEYMGSCSSRDIAGELSKLLGEFSGSNDSADTRLTLTGGK